MNTLQIKEKIKKVEKRQESNKKQIEKLEVEIQKKMLTDTWDSTENARAERRELAEENEAIEKLKNQLQQELIQAEQQEQEEQRAAAAEEYNKFAAERLKIDLEIEKAAEDLAKNLNKLLEIDQKQKTAAKRAGIHAGRAAKKLIEDYLIYILRPFISMLGIPTNKGNISEIDGMARIKE